MFLLFGSFIFSQKTSYSEIIEINGMNQKELNQKTLEWISKTFVSSKETIDLNTDSQIVVKAKEVITYNTVLESAGISMKIPSSYDMSLILSFRDSKLKFELILSDRSIKTFDEPLNSFVWGKRLQKKEYDSITRLSLENLLKSSTYSKKIIEQTIENHDFEKGYIEYREEWDAKENFIKGVFESYKTYMLSHNSDW